MMNGSQWGQRWKEVRILNCTDSSVVHRSIGLHHIHHVQQRIPNYSLQQCYDDTPALQRSNPITLLGTLRCLKLNLWDEKEKGWWVFDRLRWSSWLNVSCQLSYFVEAKIISLNLLLRVGIEWYVQVYYTLYATLFVTTLLTSLILPDQLLSQDLGDDSLPVLTNADFHSELFAQTTLGHESTCRQQRVIELASSPGCGRFLSISYDRDAIGYKLIQEDGLQIPVVLNLATRRVTHCTGLLVELDKWVLRGMADTRLRWQLSSCC